MKKNIYELKELYYLLVVVFLTQTEFPIIVENKIRQIYFRLVNSKLLIPNGKSQKLLKFFFCVFYKSKK